MDKKILLSTLWIVVMLNMIFADIFSIMVVLVHAESPEIPGDVKTMMAIAALITNIPIMMILLSRILRQKVNRLVNIIAAILTIVYVVGMGDNAPHYIIAATIEVVLLLIVITLAWRWTE